MPVKTMDEALQVITRKPLTAQDVADLTVFLTEQVAEHRRGFHKTGLILIAVLQAVQFFLQVLDEQQIGNSEACAKARAALNKALIDADAMYKN